MKSVFLFFLISLSIIANGINEEKLKLLITNPNLDLKKEVSASFLKAVPEASLKKILKKYREELGKIIKIEKKSSKYEITGENAKTKASITIKDKKVVGLWFGVISRLKDNKENILNEFKKLNGVKSIYLVKNYHSSKLKEIISFNTEKKLAVGSTFKLFVLKALENKIRIKGLSWRKTINLHKNNYSLPSGFLHTWPKGSPVTLKTLANLMISISDNTATDTLISYVGRKKIEKLSPQNKPFLKTSEMFKLKWGVSKELQDKFLNAKIKEKRALLRKEIKEFSLKDININKINSPILIDKIEWFFTTKDLVKIMFSLKKNSSLSINGGLVNTKDWYKVSYKGGSEPGVLNYTILLQKDKKSPVFILSATINNKKTIKKEFTALILRLITLIENNKL